MMADRYSVLRRTADSSQLLQSLLDLGAPLHFDPVGTYNSQMMLVLSTLVVDENVGVVREYRFNLLWSTLR